MRSGNSTPRCAGCNFCHSGSGGFFSRSRLILRKTTRPRVPKRDIESMPKSFFPEIERIKYEGPKSKNPLAFKHYNADEVVEGKTMRDHLRFAVVYWHTFRGTGGRPVRPGHGGAALGRRRALGRQGERARPRLVRVHREARRPVLRLPRPRRRPRRARRSRRRTRNLDAVVKVLKEEQERTGIKLLWGTANLFSNRRYMHGAATSPNARRLRLRRRAGEEGARSDEGARRRGLHLLGRPRRLLDAAGTPT